MGDKKLSRVDHTLPIFSPRTTYNTIRQNDDNLLSDLTLNFDPFTINVLKNEFFIRNQQLTLYEFILVVKEHLLQWQVDISNREKKLVRCLVKLFEQIDLNGNNLLEWDEFTNFIIEQATVLNQTKTKKEEIKTYTSSNIKLIQKYQNNLIKFPGGISKAVYISDIDRIAFCEEGHDEVYFMNHETGTLNQKNLKIESKPEKVIQSIVKKQTDNTFKIEKKEIVIKKKSMILDMLYIQDPKYQVLLTSNDVGFVTGWRYTSNGFILASQPSNEGEFLQHEFKNDIYCMAWDNVNELLFCGQNDGAINIWNLKNDTESQLEHIDSHTETITAMIAMPKLQFLVSASLDGSLVLWDTIKYVKKRPPYKEHKRGISCLAFNEQLILLFSGGFDHDIYVWNPYIESYITKICAHNSPLVGMIIIENTPQLISLDQEGIMKVWDIKKFNCIQTISIEQSEQKNRFAPLHLSYIKKPLKIIVSGRTLLMYEYDKNYNPLSVDDYPAICCKFDPNSISFVTPHGTKIKIWNSLNGDIKKIFNDVTVAEITAFNFDFLNKRMLIGDAEGNTGVYNILTGALIKKLPKHNSEVVKIMHIYHKQGEKEKEIINLFVTASQDYTIKISNDIKINQSELIRTITLQDIVTVLNYEPINKLIITGFRNGVVIFWESNTQNLYKMSFTIQLKQENKMALTLKKKMMKFHLSALFQICLTYLYQTILEQQVLQPFLLIYINIKEKDQEKPSAILQMQFIEEYERIYLVDEKGYLKCFSAELIIRDLKPQQVSSRSQQGSAIIKDMQSSHLLNIQQIKQISYSPQLRGDSLVLEWQIIAHKDQIKSMEVVFSENLIITTSFDKKVKLWNARQGVQIESLQQNYDKKESKPIAYKRIGTNEVYNVNFDDRIDIEYKQSTKIANQIATSVSMKKDQQQQQQKNSSDQKNVEKQKTKQVKNITNYEKSEKEEFDPFFDYQKIDPEYLGSHISSNEWKLQINFVKYHDQFEKKIQMTQEEVLNLVKQLEIKHSKEKQHVFNPPSKEKELKEQDYSKTENDIQLNLEAEEKVNINKQIDNMKLIMSKRYKQLNKNFKEEDISQRMKNHDKEKQKKIKQSEKSSTLFKKQLKDQIIDRNAPQIQLSIEECQASKKLAAALANIDQEDYRILKFYDFQEKKEIKNNKQKNSIIEIKNFVLENRDSIGKFMKELAEIKQQRLKKQQLAEKKPQ